MEKTHILTDALLLLLLSLRGVLARWRATGIASWRSGLWALDSREFGCELAGQRTAVTYGGVRRGAGSTTYSHDKVVLAFAVEDGALVSG